MSSSTSYIEIIQSQLNSFDRVSLAQINGASLLNRIDTKFLVPVRLIPEVLRDIEKDYDLLEIDERSIFSYETIYYDTPDYRFYHAHQNGHLNRFKVRFRKYLDADKTYLEVKHKNNKNKTDKRRVVITTSDFNDQQKFIQEHTQLSLDGLEPKLTNRFKRLTLVNKNYPERVTIDIDVEVFNHDKEDGHRFKQLSIIEVKKSGHGRNTPALKLFKDLRLHPEGMSKYCIGLALTNNELKSNRFKSKINKLTKLENVND